jgi:hypothetical protein
MKPEKFQSLSSLGKQEVFFLGRKIEGIKGLEKNWVKSEI